jgi:Cu/Ag efflux protein CusF
LNGGRGIHVEWVETGENVHVSEREDDMNSMRRYRTTGLWAAILCVLLLAPSVQAQQAGKKEYAFKGKVEKVDTKGKTVTVDGEKVDGWMAAMTMVYKVDKPETLTRLKPGDQITAKVREGDFQTLYDVQVVPKK